MNEIILQLNKDKSEENVNLSITVPNEGITRELGYLSLNHDLFNTTEEWSKQYRQLCYCLKNKNKPSRVIEVSTASEIEIENDNEEDIRSGLKNILSKVRKEFDLWIRSIDIDQYAKLHSHLSRYNKNVVFINTSCDKIRSLPWHLLEKTIKGDDKHLDLIIQTVLVNGGDTFRDSDNNEYNSLKILGCEGSNKFINTREDIRLIKEFSDLHKNTEIIHLNNDNSQGIDFQVFIRAIQDPRANYNVVYYCGHSGEGSIELEDESRVSPENIEYSLRQLVNKGLKLLIFNSCDGLKLAENKYIPCTIVMREEILDEVAHSFIEKFLDKYKESGCIYLSMYHARESIAEKHNKPNEPDCVDWLPIMIQSTSSIISLPELTRLDYSPPLKNDSSSKTLIFSLIAIALILALGSFCLIFFKQEPDRKQTTITEFPIQSDNIIGCYKWLNNLTIEVFADGTALQFINDERGKWKINEFGKYKYTFTWGLGWRQDVNFLPDGTVEGLNTEPNGKSYKFIGVKLKSCKNDQSSNYKNLDTTSIYENKQYKISIEYPSDWTKTEPKKPDIITREVVRFTQSSSKNKHSIPTVTIVIYPTNKDRYSLDRVIKDESNEIEESSIIKRGHTTLGESRLSNRLDAYVLIYKTARSNYIEKYMKVFFQSDKYIYYATYSFDENGFEKHIKIVENMLQSIDVADK
jgi:hypothetical protein